MHVQASCEIGRNILLAKTIAKLVVNEPLRDYIQQRLSGEVRDADGAVIGPARKGRNKPHRGDRAWATRGARNRSRSGFRSPSRMMSPCGSATRRGGFQ
jgi:hypothetical protein